MEQIALALIVRNDDSDLPALRNLLTNISPHVDDIFVNLNHKPGDKPSENIQRLLNRYHAVVYVTEWHDNFAEARNISFDLVPDEYNWILWLDVDDVVENPEKIREVAIKAPARVGGIYVDYDYTHDDQGNCTYTHKVLRMVRNTGKYHWKSSFDDSEYSVHETLQNKVHMDNGMTTDFRVIHQSNPIHTIDSLHRNISILSKMYDKMEQSGNIDPRIVFYLGSHHYDLGDYENAEKLLTSYLDVSGFAAERCEAWMYLGLIWRRQKRDDAARIAFLRAVAENPGNPEPYVELGDLEYRAKRLLESEEWLLMATHITPSDTDMRFPLFAATYRPYKLLVRTYIDMGPQKLDAAKEYAEEALEIRPFDQSTKEMLELVLRLIDERDNTRAFGRMAAIVKDKLALIDNLPDDMQDNPAVVAVRQANTEPEIWDEKTIAIYVGESLQGIWSPKDVDEKGMGGSEEAVVRLSRKMAERGWGITIYGTPGDNAGLDTEASDNGYVLWKQHWEFNPKDQFDVLIGWRNPWFFDRKYNARKTFLWLHDVMDKEDFTDERLSNISGVLFVSQYHADLYDGVIPDDKRIASGNGISTEDFDRLDGVYSRDPYRCVYTSSQLRGLEILLDIWPDVRKAIPQATLDLYYGWETFDQANSHNAAMMGWKQKMVSKIEAADGVADRGRIGQADLNKELFKSGIFAYPCIFPEVYCISIIKAQAAGCYPVTSDYAVLKAYNVTGKKVHYEPDTSKLDEFKEQYKQTLISALKGRYKETQVLMDSVRKRFSWEHVAKQWEELMS